MTGARRIAVACLLPVLLAGCASTPSEAPTNPPSSPGGGAAPTASSGLPPSPSPSGTGSIASRTPSTSSTSPAPVAAIPDFSHIYLIVFENEEDSAVVGSSQAPYINQLARTYGLATNYDAIGHPSQPNYLALASGSTDGVTDDADHDLGQPSVFDQIDASGRTWQVAAQNDRTDCYTGSTASGGADGTGNYARKHNPAISFISISRNPARCARISDFARFNPAGASFTWIVPNMCNTMHDCSIATGDAWLRSFLPAILTSPAYLQGGLVLLTFDEGTTSIGGGGRVATIVISPLGRPGFSSAAAHDHYSLLRTIETAWDLPCLANACQANDLREFFQ